MKEKGGNLKRKAAVFTALFLTVHLVSFAAPEEKTVFREGFEDAELSVNWDVSANNSFAAISRDIYHTGSQSLKTTSKNGSIVYNQSITNGVYEIWYYDANPTCYTNTSLIKLSDKTDTTGKQKYEFGMKKATYNGNLIAVTGGGEVASVAPIETGWHQLVIDAKSNTTLVGIYVDGKKTLSNHNSRMTALSNISKMTIYSMWDSYGDPIYWDDLAVYPSLADVPQYLKANVPICFSSGKTAENATDVILSDGALLFRFPNQTALSAENLVLKYRDVSSESDNDYVTAGAVSVLAGEQENEYAVQLPALEVDKTYRLEWSGVTDSTGKSYADDFILFSTGESVDGLPVKIAGIFDQQNNPLEGQTDYPILPSTVKLSFETPCQSDSVQNGVFLQQGQNRISLPVTQEGDDYLISLPKLDFDTEYQLVLGESITNGETTLGKEVSVSFSTKAFLKEVRFENGVSLPATGIPDSFGNIEILFGSSMNLSGVQGIRLLEGETPVDGCSVSFADDQKAVISLENAELKPAAEYTVKIDTDVVTQLGEALWAPITVSFVTSNNIKVQDPAFADDFEQGLTCWNTSRSLTDALSHSGEKALEFKNSTESVTYEGTVPKNGVFSAWIYDDGTLDATCMMRLAGVNASGAEVTALAGAKKGFGTYVFNINNTGDRYRGPERSKGWHRLIMDLSTPCHLTIYLDQIKLYEGDTAMEQATSFSFINYWSTSPFSCAIDDVAIYHIMDEAAMNTLIVTPPLLTNQKGQAVLDENEGLFATGHVKNQTLVSASAMLLLAEYEDGKMVRLEKSEKVVVAPGEEKSISVPVPDDAKHLKAFLWEGESLVPLGEATKPLEQPKCIAFIGGSITAGTGASESGKNYVSQVGQYFQSRYPGAKIVNAGIGGTPSSLGSARIEGDVGRHNPDVVFVEFSVNDKNVADDQVRESMELIVTRLMALPKVPKIIFLYTTTYRFEGKKEIHQQVADRYGIPSIDLEQYLREQGYTTQTEMLEILPDGVHPNDAGYALYAEKIIDCISNHPEQYLVSPVAPGDSE